MKVKAQGQLRHYFHGSYAASMVLLFDSEQDAKVIQDKFLSKLDFKIHNNPRALSWSGDSETLNKIKELLEPIRSDEPCDQFDCKRVAKKRRIRHAIDAVAHSIDYGPAFNVEFEIDNPNQLSLVLDEVPGR